MTNFKVGQRVYYKSYNGERRYGTFVRYNDKNILHSVWATWDRAKEYGYMPISAVFSDEVNTEIENDPEYESLFI